MFIKMDEKGFKRWPAKEDFLKGLVSGIEK